MNARHAAVILVFAFGICFTSPSSLSAEEPELRSRKMPADALVGAGEDSLFDYEAIVLNDNPNQATLYEECSLAGDALCAANWGVVLAERQFIGMKTGYDGPEIIYILRQGLCNPATIEDNERDGSKFTCILNYESAAEYISEAYRRGIFGLPQNTELADCWRRIQSGDMTCQDREINLYGSIVLGRRPENHK
jgi:hypothetical protein